MSLSNFPTFMKDVLRFEGYYSNDASDPGGETLFGISKVHNSTWGGWKTFEELVEANNYELPDETLCYQTLQDEVESFYKNLYWDKVRADELPSGIDLFTADIAVNMGVGRAARILQKSSDSTVDGLLGPRTLANVNTGNYNEILGNMFDYRIYFYGTTPGKLQRDKYLKGWCRRSRELYLDCLVMLRVLH